MSKLAELERVLDVRRREIDVATAALERARVALTAAEDVWGARDGRPLPFTPLACALIAVVFANGAAFCGWIAILSEFRNAEWNVGLFVTLGVALVALPFTKHAGAGGRARVGLRRVTSAFIALALIETLVALSRYL